MTLYDIRSFGARGDGDTHDTRAIQAAIDACATAGGGTVSVPAGRYVTGMLTLRSHVTLQLDPGSVLLASLDLDDFPIRESRFPGYDGRCRNHKCVVSSNASAIKLGTEASGGFRNITIGNCVIHEARVDGVSLMAVDGGDCENILIHDIVMQRVNGAAIFVRLGDRGRTWPDGQEKPPTARVRGITLHHIRAEQVGGIATDEPTVINRNPCSITGLPGHPCQAVSLESIRLRMIGGGSADQTLETVPEQAEAYPNSLIFGGDLPAYGLYCRHVDGLRLRDVILCTDEPDPRPPIILDDVQNLHFDGMEATCAPHTSAVIRQ